MYNKEKQEKANKKWREKNAEKWVALNRENQRTYYESHKEEKKKSVYGRRNFLKEFERLRLIDLF
jgi:hypothetical protein